MCWEIGTELCTESNPDDSIYGTQTSKQNAIIFTQCLLYSTSNHRVYRTWLQSLLITFYRASKSRGSDNEVITRNVRGAIETSKVQSLPFCNDPKMERARHDILRNSLHIRAAFQTLIDIETCMLRYFWGPSRLSGFETFKLISLRYRSVAGRRWSVSTAKDFI